MGFMTEIQISNDAWHEFKEMIFNDPQIFVDEIQILMNGRPQYRVIDGERKYAGSKIADEIDLPNHIGYSKVYQSHHADEPRLYLSWENSFTAFDPFLLDREYPDLRGNDRMIQWLEKSVEQAEKMLADTKKFLEEKKESK